MNHDDDELFSILERAIGPTSDDAPTDSERQRLRAIVDDVRQHRPVPITAARSRRWIRRTVATGLGSIVVVSGATAVAAAVNDGVLPAPARSVARSIGLPVESADLAKARAAVGRLRKADEDDDRYALEGQVQLALSRLSASDLAKIDAAATAALQSAHNLDEQLSANAGSGSSGSNSGSGSSGSGSSGSSGSGSGSSGSGSSGSGSSGSGSGSSGSGGESTTSSTHEDGDHGGEASTSTSTATSDDHSDGGDDTTSTTATSSTSTTDDHHGGDGGGGGSDGKSGGDN